jgi:hypothetical protein
MHSGILLPSLEKGKKTKKIIVLKILQIKKIILPEACQFPIKSIIFASKY